MLFNHYYIISHKPQNFQFRYLNWIRREIEINDEMVFELKRILENSALGAYKEIISRNI